MYPVGSVVASVNANFDPNKIYNGTWVRFAKGQTLVGVDEADKDFAAGKSGGNKNMQQHTHGISGTITTPNHTHTVTVTNTTATMNSAGNHKHLVYITNVGRNDSSHISAATEANHTSNTVTNTTGAHTHTINAHAHALRWTSSGGGAATYKLTIANSGSGTAQNLQPYITVYYWQRTA